MHADPSDPVLEAADALRADGIAVAPEGDDLALWRIGDLLFTDAELMRLAESRGPVDP